MRLGGLDAGILLPWALVGVYEAAGAKMKHKDMGFSVRDRRDRWRSARAPEKMESLTIRVALTSSLK